MNTYYKVAEFFWGLLSLTVTDETKGIREKTGEQHELHFFVQYLLINVSMEHLTDMKRVTDETD